MTTTYTISYNEVRSEAILHCHPDPEDMAKMVAMGDSVGYEKVAEFTTPSDRGVLEALSSLVDRSNKDKLSKAEVINEAERMRIELRRLDLLVRDRLPSP
ncbi:hypothetical protein GOV09_05120 [Candidatus Woesearchaeota archaeon]|nr:hypothetical protein [Candidatus Woesearchaeota archaeon]